MLRYFVSLYNDESTKYNLVDINNCDDYYDIMGLKYGLYYELGIDYVNILFNHGIKNAKDFDMSQEDKYRC